MPQPIMVFCADLQARESAYRAIKELRGDDLYAMNQVVTKCEELDVPLVMGGDQVDTPTISDEHTIKLRKILCRIPTDNNWYIDGNHERGFKRLCLEGKLAAAANNLEEASVNLRMGKHLVAGYNWRTRRQWERFLEEEQLKEADVLILHGFASQVVPALGLPPEEAPLCDLDLDWFDGKYKLVLMGDIHMEWEWTGPKGTRFVYAGSMWMHRLGEPEHKSFIVVYDDLSIKRIPLRCRPFLRTDIMDEVDVSRVQKWLNDCLAEDATNTHKSEMQVYMGAMLPRLHVKIPSELTPEIGAALELMKQRAFVFEKVDTSHDRDLLEIQGSLSEKVDLDTALVQLLDVNDSIDVDVVEFVKQAMELGFDKAVNNLKEKVGI